MIGKFNIQSMGETSFSEKIEIYGKTKGYKKNIYQSYK